MEYFCVFAKRKLNYKYLLRWIVNNLYYLQAKRMRTALKPYESGISTKQMKTLVLLASPHPSFLVSGNKAATWEFLSLLLQRFLPTPHCPAGFAVRCLRLADCGQALSSFPCKLGTKRSAWERLPRRQLPRENAGAGSSQKFLLAQSARGRSPLC